MARKRKQSIKLNNTDSLQGLMQEVYNDACGQIIDVQKTINELGLTLPPEDIDDLTKIAREKSNAHKLKDSAMRLKLEVGKLMNDIIKHNGSIEESDPNKTVASTVPTTEDFKNIRDWVKSNANIK